MEIYLIVLAAIIITVTSNEIKSVEDNEVIIRYHEYEYAENHFATRLYEAVAGDAPPNFICSPLSTYIALSALALGARGRVLEDIRTVLIDVPDSTNYEQFEIRSPEVTLKDNLNFFNQLFIDYDYKISPEYKRAVKIYRSGVTNMNFSDPQVATGQINSWGQVVSNGRISKLVPEAAIYNTKMLMLNAVYFKAMWVHKFNPDIILRPFYVDGRSPRQVPVMYQRNLLHFGSEPKYDFEYLVIPFMVSSEIDNLNMYVLLPTKKKGLQKIEDNFHNLNFTKYENEKILYNVDFYLPKFKIENTIILNDPLKNMGLGSLFDNTADFSGISKNGPLKVDRILQKVFIEVDENGSEAFTTSAVKNFGPFELRHMGNLNFEVNRPFMFAVTSGEFVLFAGRVTNPVAVYY